MFTSWLSFPDTRPWKCISGNISVACPRKGQARLIERVEARRWYDQEWYACSLVTFRFV